MTTIKFTTRRALAPLLMIAAFATACSQSSSRPTDAEIESAVKSQVLASGGDKIATVENFKRVNGFEDAQTKNYVPEVTYDLKFSRSEEDITKGWMQMSAPIPDEITDALQFLSFNKAWKAGESFPRRDKFSFRKTEKGWQPAG